MRKNSLTDAQVRTLKTDTRNIDTPFKIIASGEVQPLRFDTEKNAMTYFNKHKGRCLLTYNTNFYVRFLAYKYL